MPSQPADQDVAGSTDRLTGLIFRIFRANGRLLSAGDELIAPLGLTSARWQVLGAVAAAQPRPVAQLARDLGVSRQAVQRIANALAQEGVLAFRPNPMHKRAQLVHLTEAGEDMHERALRLQRPWADGLAAGLGRDEIEAACDLLDRFLARLEASSAADDEDAGPEDR